MKHLISGFKLILVAFAFLAIANVNAFTLKDILEEYSAPLIIEVINEGNGQEVIQAALNAGFTQIHVIESSQYAFETDFSVFGTNPNVQFEPVGNPATVFHDLLSSIEQHAAILIKGSRNSFHSVKQELKSLEGLHDHKDIILIDNFNHFDAHQQSEIKNIFHMINPHYHFSEKSIVGPNRRILIALVR